MHYNLFAKFILTLVIGAIGGWSLWHFQMPLAWLLGAMIACGLAALFGLPVALPKYSRPPMTATLGAMLGATFSPSVFDHINLWIVSLSGLVVYLLVLGTVVYLYFRRVVGLDPATAYFSALPGGMVEMIIQGGEKGGDERMIALIHVVRIFLVVMTLPFLIQYVTGQNIGRNAAGYIALNSISGIDFIWIAATVLIGVFLATLLRFPARFFLGPMIVSACVHYLGYSDFKIPTTVLAGAQIVIGATIGCRFANIPLAYIARVALFSLGSTFLCIAISLAFAFGVSYWSGDQLASLILAYSPGGITEMSLIALALGLEVPFVALHHIVRVVLVMGSASFIFKSVKRY
ncbi:MULTISPECIES: AbrB family transcriptional regulator [Pacificibacter]|uniref:AbrB family transcriptional regulator n=1 Tax=Pacificibacter TaxID=1042323 RepID=UPI001C08EA89|nr:MULTISPECIES: AbrB family transcriptional regulator [Pacificibacter]MBU2934546.1 AbrB family transcriptional regulator [Pacificibacter marinus]MDO6617332.1 AbrB family transcriptional regulator [Pacificibacter sp. 1_MG-2023]